MIQIILSYVEPKEKSREITILLLLKAALRDIKKLVSKLREDLL